MRNQHKTFGNICEKVFVNMCVRLELKPKRINRFFHGMPVTETPPSINCVCVCVCVFVCAPVCSN